MQTRSQAKKFKRISKFYFFIKVEAARWLQTEDLPSFLQTSGGWHFTERQLKQNQAGGGSAISFLSVVRDLGDEPVKFEKVLTACPPIVICCPALLLKAVMNRAASTINRQRTNIFSRFCKWWFKRICKWRGTYSGGINNVCKNTKFFNWKQIKFEILLLAGRVGVKISKFAPWVLIKYFCSAATS